MKTEQENTKSEGKSIKKKTERCLSIIKALEQRYKELLTSASDSDGEIFSSAYESIRKNLIKLLEKTTSIKQESRHNPFILQQKKYCETDLVGVEVNCKYETPYVFHLQICMPSALKYGTFSPYFLSQISSEIQKKICKEIKYRDHRFEKIYAIFVNEMCESTGQKQPYHDNDNLQIKRILDSVVCHVASDDASCYCTNIYESVFSEREGLSLFIVEKGHFGVWCERHKEVQIANEIYMINRSNMEEYGSESLSQSGGPESPKNRML